MSSQRIETISAQVDSFLTSFLTTSRHEKLNVNTLVRDGKLEFEDWYSATLGQRSKERRYIDSLKVGDLSLLFSGQIKKGWYAPEASHTPWEEQWKWMALTDDLSVLDRFNDERNWVELVLTRILPAVPASNLRAGIVGFARGVHSEWAYRRLEAAADVIFDLKLDESSREARNLLRLRRARNMPADSKWHQLKYGTKGKIEFA